MSTLDGPGPFDGVDPDTLSDVEWARRMELWMDRKRAEELAAHGPLRPGDVSEAKIRDVMGNADVRGLPDARRTRARHDDQESGS
jgi:hypothetical protein